MQKQILIGLFCLFFLQIKSQNKPILYDFAEMPQSQLLNPAFNFKHKKHIGIPFLSGLHAELGLKNITVFDFFGATSTSFSEKLVNMTNKLSSRDFLTFNGQLEIVNIGFKLNEKSYLSFGVYQETDMVLFFPKDPLALYLHGNEFNRSYNISDVNLKFDVLGVFHVGVSKRIRENVNVGARLKLYTSFIQAQSKNNTGTFITAQGDDNLLVHRLSNVDFNLQISGVEIQKNDDTNNYSVATGLASNLGLGLDFGYVNQISPQLKFSASVLDFGFINHSKKANNFKLKADYTFDGIQASFLPGTDSKSWKDLRDEIKESSSFEENTESYISLRPIKLNAALKYSFGKFKNRLCYDNSYKKEYINAFGVQFFSVFRPKGPQMALTSFYERMLTRNFKTKITYTIDSYTFSNIGIGVSTRIGKVNFYGTIGNLIQSLDFSKSNHFIAQMGINIITK